MTALTKRTGAVERWLDLLSRMGEEVVRMLLARGNVSLDHVDQFGQSPLSRAARNGHEGVAKMLLEQNNINPETVDTEYGQEVLLGTAKSKEERILKTLLERTDINPHKADQRNGTLLWFAARNRHEQVVRILPKQEDANSDLVNQFCETSLSRTACHER